MTMTRTTRWYPLDFHDITEAELEVADQLLRALDEGASTVQVTELDEDVQPTTTVAVLQRPTERLLIIVRKDRTIIGASDDTLTRTWAE